MKNIIIFLFVIIVNGQTNTIERERNIKKYFSSVDKYLFDKQNADSANFYLQKLINDTKFESKDFESEINYRKGVIELKKNNYNKAIQYYKNALTFFTKENNKSKIGKCENNIGICYDLLNKKNLALEYYSKAEKNLNKEDLPSLYNNFARLYVGLKEYKTALSYGYKSYNLLLKSTNELRKIECNNIIGNIFINNGKHEKAKEFYTKSLLIAQKKNLKYYEAISMINLAITETYLNPKNKNLSIKLYLDAKNILLNEKYYGNDIAIINFNLGEKYFKNKEYSNSELFTNECYLFSISNDESFLKSSCELLLGKIKLATKDYNKSIYYLKNAVKNSIANNYDDITAESYLHLSELYNKISQPLLAYTYIKKHIEIKDKIFKEDQKNNIEELQIKFDILNYKQNLKVKNQEIELLKIRSNQVKYQYALFVLLIFGLIFFIYRQYKIIKINKKNSLYKEQINILKEEALNKEVEFKNNQVTEFALQIKEQNKLLSNLKHNLNLIKTSVNDQENVEKLKKIQYQINETIVLNNEKIELNTEIKNNQNSFLYKLNELFPDLNDKEIQIATYLRLNFNTKQISNQLNIADQSVNNYRASIRKKLNLAKEENLKMFLKNL